jgi:hypothetical protein
MPLQDSGWARLDVAIHDVDDLCEDLANAYVNKDWEQIRKIMPQLRQGTREVLDLIEFVLNEEDPH